MARSTWSKPTVKNPYKYKAPQTVERYGQNMMSEHFRSYPKAIKNPLVSDLRKPKRGW